MGGQLHIAPVSMNGSPGFATGGFAEPPNGGGSGWSDDMGLEGAIDEAGEDAARDRFLAALPQGFLAGLKLQAASLRVVRAAGDSMAQTIADGAPMLVDTGDRLLTDGCIYVFGTDGDDRLVRRVQRQLDGSLDLIADNGRRYRSRTVAADAVEALDVVGRVRAVTALL